MNHLFPPTPVRHLCYVQQESYSSEVSRDRPTRGDAIEVPAVLMTYTPRHFYTTQMHGQILVSAGNFKRCG